MNGEHSASSRRGERRSGPTRRRAKSLRGTLVAGWILLGVALVLSVGLLVHLLTQKSAPAAAPAPTLAPGPAGSAFSGPGQALSTDEGRGGRAVKIRSIDCQFTPPGEVVIGRLETLDLSGIAAQVGDNVRAAGWGETVWSVTDNGSLLIRAKNLAQLTPADYEKQAAFLTGPQPENMARTFLENSRLIPLLRDYGLVLDTAAENDGGEICFRGAGNTPGTECTARFAFLYTGAFNQAVIRAVYLADAVTTDALLPLKRAADNAVTWSAGEGEGSVRVVDAQLRHIRGIPFYALDCSDGTVAYALAVEEAALDLVPGAAEIYRQLLRDGIQDNISIPGAE